MAAEHREPVLRSGTANWFRWVLQTVGIVLNLGLLVIAWMILVVSIINASSCREGCMQMLLGGLVAMALIALSILNMGGVIERREPLWRALCFVNVAIVAGALVLGVSFGGLEPANVVAMGLAVSPLVVAAISIAWPPAYLSMEECPGCGYDLSGTAGAVCPECGTTRVSLDETG